MKNKFIFLVLILGVILRLFLGANNNFIFNMDNARDMLDVREMVVLGEPRLIGPTTSIEGVYFGPFWYYLLAIPFLITGGDPYGSIILEIALWAIGGYFLLTLVRSYYGKLATLAVSALWLASNYIILGTQYAFNPNPILFLTPIFIYSLLKYVETKNWLYAALGWILAGSFFHFSVPVGIFMPLVYFLSLLWIDKKLVKTRALLSKAQIIGLVSFGLTFLPQLIFDIRHNFFMLNNLLNYNSISHGDISLAGNVRFKYIVKSFYETLLPTFMNFRLFTNITIVALLGVLIYNIKKKTQLDNLTKICLLLVFVPLITLNFIKIDILRWYLNETMVASIFLVGFIVSKLQNSTLGKFLSFGLVAALLVFTLQNVYDYMQDTKRPVGNSHLRTEIAAIDFVYQKSEGKNFKVYTYLPSVYDYPYQYLFWWHGLKKYGYLPEEYAYLPNKPAYVVGKERIKGGLNPQSSGLIFLIKEPDQINQRHLWENTFRDLELLESHQLGPLVIEMRRESSPIDSI